VQDEPLDFAVTYQTLFLETLEHELTPRLKERLRALGLDLDRKLLPGYPAKLWPAAMRATAAELYPQLELQEAATKLGTRFIERYFGSTLGSAVAIMLRTLGPMRALGRVERALRNTNNYQRTKFTPRGDKQAELWIAEVNGVAGWFTGMFKGTCQRIGVKDPRIEVIADDGHSATFLLSWG
jgi:uncharacterized protein (TIGR02265 family)